MENEEYVITEDRLFDEEIIKLIEGTHNVEVDRDSIVRRTMINGYEVDVVVVGYTLIRGLKRVFLFELKEHDLKRAIIQAYARSLYGDYTYIIIAKPIDYIVDYIIRYHKIYAEMLHHRGIGIISYEKPPVQYIDAKPVLVRPAKWIKRLAGYYEKYLST